MEMPDYVIPENSVHSMPQSTVFTEVEERQSSHKPKKIKNKKIICLLVVALFGFAYYIMVKNLKLPEVVKVE